MTAPQSGPLRNLLFTACASIFAAATLLATAQTNGQEVLADSIVEFSGVQGQDDWWHGYRNLTLDGGANDYDPASDFIAFPPDAWRGAQWRLAPSGAPWTTLGQENTHPNGTNSAPNEEHWTVRRWTASPADLASSSLLQVEWFIAKTNTNGEGVTAQLHLNGTMVGRASIAGNNNTGVNRMSFVTVESGDHVDLVHTPTGPGGNTRDGSDGSVTSMVISTVVDVDNDQLADSWERLWFPDDLTQLASGNDYDGDTITDEDEFANGTNPAASDTDGDGYPDSEEVTAGSDASSPSSLPPGGGLADSRDGFSGVQDQDGWSFGYRNYTADGGGNNYDPASDYIAFPPDTWRGSQWRLASSGAPWTTLGPENTHPNGTNSAPNEEHWTVRRWTAGGLDGPTDIRIYWQHRSANGAGDGTTGAIHLNGRQVDSLAVSDTVGGIRSYYVHLENGDIIDQVVTPVGVSGTRIDGSDGSYNWMRIDTRIPETSVQPNGKYFIPVGAPDLDGDSIADFVEADLFSGDLNQLTNGQDWDGDGADDEVEVAAGSDPTLADTDNDGLLDGEELTIYGSNPCLSDSDGDGLNDFDEVNGDPATDPAHADSDGDGFNDREELEAGSDPNSSGDTPLSGTLADSVTQFSGIQDQDGWESGYRNVSLDGGGRDYDPDNDFIPFTGGDGAGPWDGVDQQWIGTVWDLNTAAAAPWTFLGGEGTHPNGTNNGDEHWTIRRWTASDLTGTTAVRLSWTTKKTNPNGDGVTGGVHLNVVQLDGAVVSDTTGVTRILYANLNNGDRIDLILSPHGLTDGSDGSDGSANAIRIDNRIPTVPIQPDGTIFIPADAADSDDDGIADFWEELFFPGDLSQLSAGSDFDSDGLNDGDEALSGTDPLQADTDGDGLSDGAEITAGTDALDTDSDGDTYEDFHEIATGFDPLDAFSNVADNFTAIADSEFDFPFSADPQGDFGWTYGYYNTTQDGEPPANSNFIPFPTDGSFFPGAGNFWDGLKFDWSDAVGNAQNPPWTEISQLGGHPNGDNNSEVHWATRRWEVPQDAQLALHYFVQKTNPNGSGVTAIILHNGEQLHRTTIAGNDTAGRKGWSFIDARAGDHVEVALSPRGIDGSDHDGADGSNFWLIVDPTIPPTPLQPDGSPFVPDGGEDLRLTLFSYNGTNVTLRWISRNGNDYQVQESVDLQNWNNIGATVPAAAGGVTEATILNAPASPRYYRLLELDP